MNHVPGTVLSARVTNTVNVTNLYDFFESNIYSTRKWCHSKTVNINLISTSLEMCRLAFFYAYILLCNLII